MLQGYEQMLDVAFMIGWIFIPFLLSIILRVAGLELLRISIPSVLIGYIFILQYLGFPILYFSLDDYRAEFVTNKSLLVEVWFITSFTSVLLCAGALVGSLYFGKLKYKNFLRKNNKKYCNFNKYKYLSVQILIFMVLWSYLSVVGFDNIAIIKVLSETTPQDINIARSGMGNDFGSSYHWYGLFFKDIYLLILLMLYAEKLENKKLISNSVIIIVTLMYIFTLIMSAEKSLIIDFFIATSLLYFMLRNGGYIPKVGLLMIFLISLLTLSVMYIFFMGDSNVNSAIASVFSRGLTGSMQPAYHYMEFFPTHHDLLWGASFPNPRGLLPFENYNLTSELMNFVHPEQIKLGVIGSMPAIYWAEIYANFGYLGLVILPLLIGLALYIINYFLFNLKHSPSNVALFIWVVLHYKTLSVTSFSSYLFDLNIVIIVLIYLYINTDFKIINRNCRS